MGYTGQKRGLFPLTPNPPHIETLLPPQVPVAITEMEISVKRVRATDTPSTHPCPHLWLPPRHGHGSLQTVLKAQSQQGTKLHLQGTRRPWKKPNCVSTLGVGETQIPALNRGRKAQVEARSQKLHPLMVAGPLDHPLLTSWVR